MAISPLSLRSDYWETFEFQDEDLEFIYSHLLENETPLNTQEILRLIVDERIRKEKNNLEQQKPDGANVYLPKEHYQVKDTLVFPALDWKKGTVVNVRPGKNPEVAAFEVIDVQMDSGEHRLFAAALDEHALNQPLQVKADDPLLTTDTVLADYGEQLTEGLFEVLGTNPDLVQVGRTWFPRALLVDVNVGHLNLAEAVLDMVGGGPMTTAQILEQIELPTDTNTKLTEFSLNLALQEDPRFDEVGPSGEIVWFLNRLEPEQVQRAPVYLRYNAVEYDRSVLTPAMLALEAELDDELSNLEAKTRPDEEVSLYLSYPHWRAGTLPLSARVARMFPTAHEAPRVQFNFRLGDEGDQAQGWVVRPNRYIFGLRDWYEREGLLPGSRIIIRPGKEPGEVIVRAEKHRQTREWVRTVIVGADGGIVFAMLKQGITAKFDDRMVFAIPDVEGIDRVWEPGAKRGNLENTVTNMMRELAKLTPQGAVHAQELYAAVNIIRRCPPGPIFSLLASQSAFVQIGDLYYRLDDSASEETST